MSENRSIRLNKHDDDFERRFRKLERDVKKSLSGQVNLQNPSYVPISTSKIPAPTNDHGALTGLDDDDHPQYILITDIEDTPTEDEADKVTSSEWLFDHDANVAAHHAKWTTGDTETVITAELVNGQSIDNAIDSLIATHKAIAGDHHAKWTTGNTETVITAELVNGQSIDNAIDALIATHKAIAGDHHAATVAGDLNHNELAALNAGDNYEHITQGQKNLLHAIYTHPTGTPNFHIADDGTNDTKILTGSGVAGVFTWEAAGGGALTEEEVEDIAGALVASGGTKTRIAVTYQDGTDDIDFVVDDMNQAAGDFDHQDIANRGASDHHAKWTTGDTNTVIGVSLLEGHPIADAIAAAIPVTYLELRWSGGSNVPYSGGGGANPWNGGGIIFQNAGGGGTTNDYCNWQARTPPNWDDGKTYSVYLTLRTWHVSSDLGQARVHLYEFANTADRDTEVPILNNTLEDFGNSTGTHRDKVHTVATGLNLNSNNHILFYLQISTVPAAWIQIEQVWIEED